MSDTPPDNHSAEPDLGREDLFSVPLRQECSALGARLTPNTETNCLADGACSADTALPQVHITNLSETCEPKPLENGVPEGSVCGPSDQAVCLDVHPADVCPCPEDDVRFYFSFADDFFAPRTYHYTKIELTESFHFNLKIGTLLTASMPLYHLISHY